MGQSFPSSCRGKARKAAGEAQGGTAGRVLCPVGGWSIGLHQLRRVWPGASEKQQPYLMTERNGKSNVDLDRQENIEDIGRQMLLRMGWTVGSGLGLKGTGRREPITDDHVGRLHAREEGEGGAAPGAGVAMPMELLRLKRKPETDWKKGSSDSRKWEDLTAFFDRAGTLADQARSEEERLNMSNHQARRAHIIYVGGRPTKVLTSSCDEEIVVEHRSTGQKVRCASLHDVRKLKGRWDEEDALDKVSTSPGYFFACCKFADHQTTVQTLCIETTGEAFPCKVDAASGGDLKEFLQKRLGESTTELRVLGPRLICGGASEESADGRDSSGEDGHYSHLSLHESSPPEQGDSGLSAQRLEVLEREFHGPAREGDEESVSSELTEVSLNPTEVSFNPGHHASERLAERGISDEEIRLAKRNGQVVISIEQRRGGDPELTTYQLNCKRQTLRELGSRLANRFPNIVANEPVERGKGRGIHRRLEMRLDGSEGLGPAVKKLLDEEWFGSPSRCSRCQHVHIIRLTLFHKELVVVEARPRSCLWQRQPRTCAWEIVTAYKREKPPHRASALKSPLCGECFVVKMFCSKNVLGTDF